MTKADLLNVLIEWHHSSKAMYAAQVRYEKRGDCPNAGTDGVHSKECLLWDKAISRASAAQRKLEDIAEAAAKQTS